MNFWNLLRKIEKIRFYVGMILIGAVFIVLSAFALSRPEKALLSTEGVIEHIEAFINDLGEEENTVFVSYKDNTGTAHENICYPAFSSSMKPGDKVTVLYDPLAPEEIQAPGGDFMPYLILGLGILLMAGSVVKIALDIKKSAYNSPFENSEIPVDPVYAEQIRNSTEPTEDFYFHWTGKLNQSYILETLSREPVCEAVCDHIGVLKPYRYTFKNHRSGRLETHEITHTTTKGYGNGAENSGISVVSSSDFKIDGVNNWAYLEKLGYSVVPKLEGIRLNFDVLYQGVPVAFLEAAGVNILKDGGSNPLGDKLPGTGLFRVSARESDLNGVFMACFSVARVEFF